MEHGGGREGKAWSKTEVQRRFGGEHKGQDDGEKRHSGAAHDESSTEVDGQPLSVKLTQREQGPAICSKVNGKETRWEGEMCRHSPEGPGERERREDGGLSENRRRAEVEGWRPRTEKIIE